MSKCKAKILMANSNLLDKKGVSSKKIFYNIYIKKMNSITYYKKNQGNKSK